MFSENSSFFSSFCGPQLPHLYQLNLVVLPVPPSHALPTLRSHRAIPAARWGPKAGTSRRCRTCALAGGAPPSNALRTSLPARAAGPAGWGVRVGSVRAAGRGSRRRLTRAPPRSRAGECPRAGVTRGPGRGTLEREGRPEVGHPSRERPQEMGTPGEGVTAGSGGLGRCRRDVGSLGLQER